MGRKELLAAEAVVLELEDELASNKEYPPDSAEYMAMKLRLREARYRFRTMREGGEDPGPPGDAVAKPAPVKTRGKVR